MTGSPSGDMTITGLPFTVKTGTYGGGAISDVRAFAGDYPSSVEPLAGTKTLLLFYRTAVNGGSSVLQGSDMATGGGVQNLIDASFTYIVD